MNNPLRYTDPTGMSADDVIIKGEKAQETFYQLRASVGGELTLTMDNEGKVTAEINEGATLEKGGSAETLFNATRDTDRDVEVTAVGVSVTSEGKKFLGGAFGGNDGKTAKQTVNPNDTEFLEKHLKRGVGSSILHEVNEAYIGVKERPGAKAATEPGEHPGYDYSHNKAAGMDRGYKHSKGAFLERNLDIGSDTFWFNVTNQKGQTKESPHYTIPRQ